MELSLWDTAGQEDFDMLRSLSYADTHVVLVCFEVDRPVSLENVQTKWMPEVRQHCPGVKVILAALKCDLRDEPQVVQKLAAQGQRPVSYDEGLAVAKKIKATRYLECSAMYNRGVKEAIQTAGQVALGAKGAGRGGGGGGGAGHGSGCCIVM